MNNDFIMYNIHSSLLYTRFLFTFGMYNIFVKAFLWSTSLETVAIWYDYASKMTPSGNCACANSFEQMSLAIGLSFGMRAGGRRRIECIIVRFDGERIVFGLKSFDGNKTPFTRYAVYRLPDEFGTRLKFVLFGLFTREFVLLGASNLFIYKLCRLQTLR